MEVSLEDLAQQRIIPYVRGHELPIMHDVVKWIVGSIVGREFWNHEPSWRVVVDDVRVERCGEHVIRSPTDRAGGTLVDRIPH